jgi:hypothetical protein
MRHVFVPVIAAVGLMAIPAFAATTTGATTPSTGTSQNTEAQNPAQMSQETGQIRQNLRRDLSQAGYTDIHIAPGSFLVRAKDKQGHPIEMMISPDSVLEVATIPAASSNIKTSSNMSPSNNTGTSGAAGSNGSSAQSGK